MQVYLAGDHVHCKHHSLVTAAREAECDGVTVDGIVSTSPLASIVDLIDSMPVDYMHAVLEGVIHTLLKAWFLTCNHGEPYYLGSKLAAVDKVLLKQRLCELS